MWSAGNSAYLLIENQGVWSWEMSNWEKVTGNWILDHIRNNVKINDEW